VTRGAVVAAAVCALLLVPAATAATSASLRITVWPEGRNHGSTTWTLRCAPNGGTLPARARACRRLASLRSPFAPVPRDTACTQVYGGPQVAHVRGTFLGRRVEAWFNRQDGCEVQRWQAVRFLFPVGTS
jgi:subtilisin inhibitor-like